jgi:proteasome lid subunit RPN8/RPN11
MAGEGGLWLEPAHWAQMQAHVQRCAPEEACGLLVGTAGRVRAVCEITNALHSPVRFRMAEQEQVNAFLELEQRGWELLAIYHSHPNGPPGPSPTDLAEFAYPGVLYVIWSLQASGWEGRAFWIQESRTGEVPVQFVVE